MGSGSLRATGVSYILREMQPNSPVVGRYHLVERLAVGGMAEIFLACEKAAHGLERLVVVKRILPTLAEDESFVEMFLQEARVAAGIQHPNVVAIHELGEADGLPYMTMEYVPGSTMRQLLQAASVAQREVPVEVALDLAMQACAGAHAVHELCDPYGKLYGLVHRDLTPHNLMVTDEGFVKLLDFGIAKATHESDLHTRTGVLKGKVAYMSPEQCQQETLDRRSDIFALGNVTWELLAGEKLFQAANELGVMQAIITGNVRDLRKVRPEVPDPVVNVIEHALAPARESRYDTADDMRRALAEAAAASGLVIDRDRTAAFVREMLGEKHDYRRESVQRSLDRTLVTAAGGEAGTRSRSLTQVTTATRVGLIGALGALTLGLAGGAFVVVGVALVVAGLWNAGWFEGDTDVPYIPPEGEPVHLVLAPINAPGELAAEWEPLRRYLEQAIDTPIDLTVSDSYEDASQALLRGEAEYAMLPPKLYLKTHDADPEGVTMLATKVYDGSSGFEGVLLVSVQSTATRIEDLRGATLCYADIDSTTGYDLPRSWIRKAGLDPDVDFVPHFSGNHTQVLLDLVDATCRVGGTFTGNYLAADTEIKNQLRMLAVTGYSPHDTVTAGPTAAPETTEKLREALLAFDPPTQLGRERLAEKNERITGFDPPDLEKFEELRRVLALGAEPGKSGGG